MNVWVFQDAPGENLAAKMRDYPKGTHTWWHVDRYFSESASPRIEVGDKVLLWQPHLDATSPAGIYAVARVTGNPYWSKDEESKWRRIGIRITKVLSEPLARDEIRETGDQDLLAMLVIRMPAGHIVFPVEEAAWEALKRLNRELAT
jgi:predicted RNA-binding protein with PUA-like domain